METTHTALKENVGAMIRKARLQRGMTQKALAEEVGLTYQQIQKYESGRSSPDANRLQEFSRALGVQVGDFFPASLQELGASEPVNQLSPSFDEWSLLLEFRQIPPGKDRQLVRDLVRRLATTAAKNDMDTGLSR